MNAGSKQSIECRDKSLDLSVPVVVGILNITPDSFFDGGNFSSVQAAIDRIGQMVDEGAHVIDIGGESTRPGADPVSVDMELKRVVPVLEKAVSLFKQIVFSVDTTKYTVAEAALEAGAHIINDVSGLQKEPRLAGLCSTHKAAYILMHSQGNPQNMQDDPRYTDVISDIKAFFEKQISVARESGEFSIILDPGLGFGKTVEHNVDIVSNLDKLVEPGYPLMIGASRKSMIGKLLDGRPVDGRLIGTIAVHYHSLIRGARLLRVHDVKEAVDSVKIYQALQAARE